MPNPYILIGLGTGIVGLGLVIGSCSGWPIPMGAGALLLAFGLGIAKGRHDRFTEDRVELDRMFEEAQSLGRLASFVSIPDRTLREIAQRMAEWPKAIPSEHSNGVERELNLRNSQVSHDRLDRPVGF